MLEKNISLYQIGAEYQSLLSQLYDMETGEVDAEVERKLNALAQTSEKKCIAIGSYIQKMEGEKREIDYLKSQLAAREAAYTKEINRLHDYLKTNMERLQIKEVSCPYFTIQLKTNPFSTEIFDEAQIPSEFMKVREILKTEVKPNKTAIKEEFLKTGQQIPGTYVSQKTQVKISIDKI